MRYVDSYDPINRNSPFTYGMVSAWLIGDQSPYWGTDKLRDVWGSGLNQFNHGTLTTGPKWSGSAPPGGRGSLNFDGTTNQGVTTPLAYAAQLSTPLTVSFWFNPGSLSQASNAFLAAAYEGGNNRHTYRLITGSLTQSISNGGAAVTDLTISTGLATGQWFFCVHSYQASVQNKMWLFSAGGLLLDSSSSTPNNIGAYIPAWYIGGVGSGTLAAINAYVADVQFAFVNLSDSGANNLCLESILGYPTLRNYISRPVLVGAAASTNRRRRILCGVAA